MFLIEALVASIWQSDDARNGLAAFNVGGITIHRLFQLPVEHEGCSLLLVAAKSFSKSYENHASECENDYHRQTFHGFQSQLGIHALEIGRTVWWY